MAKAKVEANYSATVEFCSKELSAKERVLIKDTTDAVKLDTATAEESVIIDVDWFATLNIHNEKSDTIDYKNYILVDKNGVKYVTGSQAFYSSFKEIYDEMAGESEAWSIKAYQVPSKNFTGKNFLTCSIV